MASARSVERSLTLAATRWEKGCWVGAGDGDGIDAGALVRSCSWSCVSPSPPLGCMVKDGINIMSGVEEESVGLLAGIST